MFRPGARVFGALEPCAFGSDEVNPDGGLRGKKERLTSR